MIDFKLQFQAVAFLNLEDFETNAKNITASVNAFEENGLLPITFQEINQNGATSSRIGLKSESGDLIVKFGTKRVDIERLPLNSKNQEAQNIPDFCQEVLDMFAKVYKITGKNSHRLALSSQYLLNEMNEKEFDRAFNVVFKPTPFYLKNLPSEWNRKFSSKADRKFGDKIETCNFISEINRVQGSLSKSGKTQKFDRLQLKTDINTHQGNEENRFGIDDVRNFFTNVSDSEELLKNEILDSIK